MTDASTGLRKALGRSASGEVIALAEMNATDLLASLGDDQKAELAAALAPEPAAAAAEEMPPKKDGCSEDGDEDDADGDKDKGPMAAASDDRIKVVAAAVENDDACKGKASLALQMLADDDYAGLNGAAMVKLLGKTNIEGAAASADVEGEDRAAMQAALKSQDNSNARVCPGAAK